MQDFLSLYSKIENPTLPMIVFTFLLAFLCSCLIALTYYKTSPTTLKTPSFVQAVILSSLIATMILQSIGDSLASGLGILGALTIINFRTSFRDPRDIIFMFASLGTGIACGSYVFLIAILGTVSFCFIAFCLQFSPFHVEQQAIWDFRVKIEREGQIPEIEAILEKHTSQFSFDGIKRDFGKDGLPTHEWDYVLVFSNDRQKKSLLHALEQNNINIKRFNKQATEFTFAD
jgi:uncharacterized membrane protein YhiD involved in acid resistance